MRSWRWSEGEKSRAWVVPGIIMRWVVRPWMVQPGSRQVGKLRRFPAELWNPVETEEDP